MQADMGRHSLNIRMEAIKKQQKLPLSTAIK